MLRASMQVFTPMSYSGPDDYEGLVPNFKVAIVGPNLLRGKADSNKRSMWDVMISSPLVSIPLRMESVAICCAVDQMREYKE